MLRILVPVLASLAVLAAPAGAAAKPKGYEVGAAKRLANPPAGDRLCLGGYGSCPDGGGRTMTGIADDLYARATAISQGGKGFVLVHTVNIGLFAAYKADASLGIYGLRQEVARRTGIDAGSVIVQADHSHSGPDTIGIWGGVPTSYLRRLQTAAADAAVAAWKAREPADVFVGTAQGPGPTSSYSKPPNVGTDDEFRMLWADAKDDGDRIATLSNYSPHATVQKSSNKLASGDWPEWAAQIAEEKFGGHGQAGVGTLGREDFGANGGNDAERESDARARLSRLIDQADAAGRRVDRAGGVAVKSVFIREPIAQPVLMLNHLPEGAVDAGGYDISIDRSVQAPWYEAQHVGTYAGAARVGNVFFGMSPGEPFPQIQWYLREEGGITGAPVMFHLGAANDFLGYMVRPIEDYAQPAQQGFAYLAGCPQNAILQFLPEQDDACPDHWTLMVSPTIGSHVACTIQDAGIALGFGSRTRDPNCEVLTARDGERAPSEASAMPPKKGK